MTNYRNVLKKSDQKKSHTEALRALREDYGSFKGPSNMGAVWELTKTNQCVENGIMATWRVFLISIGRLRQQF